MSTEFVRLAHHASALAILAVMALGIVAPRLKSEALRAQLFPVEGMGGFGVVLFQVVSGATLAGRAELPWGTPWIAGGIGGLVVALVLWGWAMARRSNGRTADRAACVLNGLALLAVLVSYGLMMAKPT